MNRLSKISIVLLGFMGILSLSQCKTQNIANTPPFTITEKTYFSWTGGKKGSSGVNIKIAGTFNTTNLSFSKIYFQNREYKVVPEINGTNFSLVGSYSVLTNKENDMYSSSIDEYGNVAPKIEKNIPFDLQKDEAIIVYAISGEEKYYKVKGIKQLETVFYP